MKREDVAEFVEMCGVLSNCLFNINNNLNGGVHL